MSLRIDAHQHFWHYRAADYPWIDAAMTPLAQDYLPSALQPLLLASKLQATIAVPARGSRAETRFLLELAQQTPWMAGVVAWEDLGADDLAERLAQWQDSKLLGWRHQVQDQSDVAGFLAQAAFQRGMRLLQDQAYVYEVLVQQHQLADTQRFCAQHDRHWLVLDHLGKPALHAFSDRAVAQRWQQQITALAQLPHVACKLSGLLTEADWRRGVQAADMAHIFTCLDVALEVFGPQRLMFGSDWPVCLLAASYPEVVQVVADWSATRLNTEEQAALWGGTAARCYRIAI